MCLEGFLFLNDASCASIVMLFQPPARSDRSSGCFLSFVVGVGFEMFRLLNGMETHESSVQTCIHPGCKTLGTFVAVAENCVIRTPDCYN